MKNVTSATLAIALFLTLVILGISIQAYTFHKCGFYQTMFYGERAFFAAILGECNE